MNIEPGAAVLDSRDIEDAILDLQDDIEAYEEDIEKGLSDDFTASELEELNAQCAALLKFKEEVDSREWDVGMTFIHEDYREDYVEDFVRDVEGIDDSWIMRHIDWESAAREFYQMYEEVELLGERYYFRPT